MSPEQVNQLFGYVQERCLWQFFSRSWDRQENIEGVFKAAGELLAGNQPARETPMERLFYADAKLMVADFRERFPWLGECGAEQIGELMRGLKERIAEIAVSKSLNGELNHALY